MDFINRWKKSEAILGDELRELSRQDREDIREFVLPLEDGKLRVPVIKGHCRPSDEASVAARKRDVKVAVVAFTILAITASLVALYFGAPHTWDSFASFVQKHPMALAGPLGAAAIIAFGILSGKKGANKEVVTLIALAAILVLGAGALHMEAPSALKYILRNPQLMAMPLLGYGIVRFTHLKVSQKKFDKQAVLDMQIAIRDDDTKEMSDRRLAETHVKKLEAVKAEQQESYKMKAGMIATAALLAVIGCGLLGWPHAYPAMGDFFKHEWKQILTASVPAAIGVGIIGTIVWAFNRGARATEREQRRVDTLEDDRSLAAIQAENVRTVVSDPLTDGIVKKARYEHAIACLLDPSYGDPNKLTEAPMPMPTDERVLAVAEREPFTVELMILMAKGQGHEAEALRWKEIVDKAKVSEIIETPISKELYREIAQLVEPKSSSDFAILSLTAERAGDVEEMAHYQNSAEALEIGQILGSQMEILRDDELQRFAFNHPVKMQELIENCTGARKERLERIQATRLSDHDLIVYLLEKARAGNLAFFEIAQLVARGNPEAQSSLAEEAKEARIAARSSRFRTGKVESDTQELEDLITKGSPTRTLSEKSFYDIINRVFGVDTIAKVTPELLKKMALESPIDLLRLTVATQAAHVEHLPAYFWEAYSSRSRYQEEADQTAILGKPLKDASDEELRLFKLSSTEGWTDLKKTTSPDDLIANHRLGNTEASLSFLTLETKGLRILLREDLSTTLTEPVYQAIVSSMTGAKELPEDLSRLTRQQMLSLEVAARMAGKTEDVKRLHTINSVDAGQMERQPTPNKAKRTLSFKEGFTQEGGKHAPRAVAQPAKSIIPGWTPPTPPHTAYESFGSLPPADITA